jgi:hypothetical protein
MDDGSSNVIALGLRDGGDDLPAADPPIISYEELQQRAFIRYRALYDHAHQTGEFADAQAAGRAWRRFLDLFCSAPLPTKGAA